jgi:LPXTG-motif cell wall-anchored protein
VKGEGLPLHLSKPARAARIAVVVCAIAGASIWQGVAHAAPTSCVVSRTTVPQGGSFTVSGNGDTNAEFIRVILDGSTQIGSGFTNTTGSPITFSITATIPASTSANATHTLDVRDAVVFPCPSILVTEAEAEPEASTSPSPSTSPAVAASPAAPALPQQQQQQQQQVVLPVAIPAVAHSVSGTSLPKTGTQAQTFGLYGVATLLAGLVLVRFSRRARLALGAVGAAVLRRPTSEADLLLPYRGDPPPE